MMIRKIILHRLFSVLHFSIFVSRHGFCTVNEIFTQFFFSLFLNFQLAFQLGTTMCKKSLFYTQRYDAEIHFQCLSLSAWVERTCVGVCLPVHHFAHKNFMQIKQCSIMLSFYHYPMIFTSSPLCKPVNEKKIYFCTWYCMCECLWEISIKCKLKMDDS